MALELLKLVALDQTPVLHIYEHDAEAVCWVILGWQGEILIRGLGNG